MATAHPETSSSGFGKIAAWWHAVPLYLRILLACIVGGVLGVLLREFDRGLHVTFDSETRLLVGQLIEVGDLDEAKATVEAAIAKQMGFWRFVHPLQWAEALAIPSKLVLRLLGALAAPLVLVAVVQAEESCAPLHLIYARATGEPPESISAVAGTPNYRAGFDEAASKVTTKGFGAAGWALVTELTKAIPGTTSYPVHYSVRLLSRYQYSIC